MHPPGSTIYLTEHPALELCVFEPLFPERVLYLAR